MTYLLDTNAVSEITKPVRNNGFDHWLAMARPADFHLSVLTIGELRRGVTSLPEGRKRHLLESLNHELIESFEERIFPVTSEIAALWGDISGRARRKGRAIAAIDGLIAATAIIHDLTVVTRNGWDFDPTECRMISPWSES